MIIDTNVISEMMRPTPSPLVHRWLGAQPRTRVYSTTICEAEIFAGVSLLPRGKKRDRLTEIAEEIFAGLLAGRVLPFDSAAARAYGELLVARRRHGRAVATFDVQIAAIALSVGADLATRNIDDFDDTGIVVINPWN